MARQPMRNPNLREFVSKSTYRAVVPLLRLPTMNRARISVPLLPSGGDIPTRRLSLSALSIRTLTR